MEKYLNEEEQQKLILENEYIVRCVLKQIGIAYTDNRYEDLCSIGKIGLVKAALSFDKSQNVMFKSYATKCIRNEIFMAFRKWRKEKLFISLEDTVDDHEGNVAILADVVPDNSSNFEDRFLKKEMLEECLGIILNVLSPKERSVILYKLSKDTQQEIAEELGFTQSYISRLDKNTTRKLKLYLEKGKQYNKNFSMEIEHNVYKLFMKLKDVEIVLRFPPTYKSFEFVARIVEQLERIK